MTGRNPYFDAPRLPEGDQVDPRELIGSTAGPVELEIGPGRGGFMFERLAAFPEVRIMGLEVRLKWAKIVDTRLGQRGLGDRGRVFAEDATRAISRFPDACLSAVFIHFPDPWWKKRHQKRLVVKDTLVLELCRVMAPGAELFIQTDVEERAAQYAEIFDGASDLVPADTVARVPGHPYVARSPRERRAMADGIPIYRLRYRRVGTPSVFVPVGSIVESQA